MEDPEEATGLPGLGNAMRHLSWPSLSIIGKPKPTADAFFHLKENILHYPGDATRETETNLQEPVVASCSY